MTANTRLPVLVAVTDGDREAAFVTAFDDRTSGVQVLRRCVDVADLLAAGEAGTARAALVSADLRGLDRDCLARLAACGLATVGVAADDAARARLVELGADAVLPLSATPAELGAALATAVRHTADPDRDRRARRAFAGGGAAVEPASPPEPPVPAPPVPAPGRVLAVWGPTGAPGRTTVATGLAGEFAERGLATVLVDADVYGGVIAPVLGMLDESPGLAAAARLATAGTLDPAVLAGLCRAVGPRLSVLTGLSRADRWPELRPAAVEAVLALARSLAAMVVVDCAFNLEQDEELSYDTVTPRRNGATLAALAAADDIIVVGTADPIGLQRLVRGLGELRELCAQPLTVVVNRLRKGVAGADPEAEIAAALRRYAGVDTVWFIPYDRGGCDAALAAGRLLAEATPATPARLALRRLAAALAGEPERRPVRRWRRRPTAAAVAAMG